MITVLVNLSLDSFLFFSFQVNDTSLEDVTHEDAVAALKKTRERVVIVVSRVGMSFPDSPPAAPPPRYQDAVKSSK